MKSYSLYKLILTGLLAWLIVGVPAFIYHAGALPFDVRWAIAFLLFGALFVADLRRPWLAWVAGESAKGSRLA